MSEVVGGLCWSEYENVNGAVFLGIQQFDISFAADMSIVWYSSAHSSERVFGQIVTGKEMGKNRRIYLRICFSQNFHLLSQELSFLFFATERFFPLPGDLDARSHS